MQLKFTLKERNCMKEQPDWSQLVYYDETSPSCLRWKITIRCGKNFNVVRVSENEASGTKAHRKNGDPMWWQIGYKGKRYRLHRVLWEILNGAIPDGLYVDHIDGNPFNNKISNLRLVSAAYNSRNTRAHRRGLPGISGVFFEQLNGCEYYIAHWSEDGKLKRKRFPVSKHGTLAFDLALDYRKSKIKTLEGYTERHGNE